MSEKTEQATPYKLKKAREQGQVSKSTELNTCIVLLVLLGIIAGFWEKTLRQIESLSIHLLNMSHHTAFNVKTMANLQHFLLSKITGLWLPLSLTGIITIIVSTIAQTGFVWSTKSLSPNFKRMNLMQGFKRLFSTKLLFESGKNILKSIFALLLLSISIRHELPVFLNMMHTSPMQLPQQCMHIFFKITFELLALLSTLALVDTYYTRWKFSKDQRMSKQEIKEEYKSREGDPQIKSKIKQLQQQLRQKTASLKQVKTADVLITNPTHLAIALQYDKERMPSPKVVCKAQGELAKQVKTLAARHRIPMIENKTFARALFATTALNQCIAQEHFPVAAVIFREIYRQRGEI